MKNLMCLSVICLVLVGCAPSKQKLASMSEYELCDWIYQFQRSAQPEYQRYYWEELRTRNVSNCNQHERQIREVHAARHQNMMNLFNAMAIGAAVSESRTPYNQNNNSTTNNYYVAPQPLPPVIITPPNTIPKK